MLIETIKQQSQYSQKTMNFPFFQVISCCRTDEIIVQNEFHTEYCVLPDFMQLQFSGFLLMSGAVIYFRCGRINST